MKVPDRAVALVSEGLRPAEIARQVNLPTDSIIQFLSAAVAKGRLRRSDVLFTLSKELRNAINLCAENMGEDAEKIQVMLKGGFGLDADLEEVRLYLNYREKQVQLGNMYEILSEMERTLHAKIKAVLVEKFGSVESGWWRQGIAEGVRADCAESRERDSDFYEHPYGYTTLIHLKEILVKSWALFKTRLPAEVENDKPGLVDELTRLNSIRNRVMHPVRGEPPSEDDFEFVKEMKKKLQVSRWR